MKLSRNSLILVGILMLGAILRAVYFAESLDDPTFRYPDVDAVYHDYWARLIVGETPPPYGYPDPQIDSTPFFRPPGYPFFLALVRLVAGPSHPAAAAVQLTLSLASSLLLYLIGRKWFGDAVGLVSCAMMATYWVFIYFSRQLLEPVLLVALSLLLLYCLGLWTERLSSRIPFISGIVAGLSVLVRPNLLLFVAAIPLWAFWLARRRRAPHTFWIPSFVFILGTAIAVAPATLRNWIRAREFVPISTNAGINLYIGNNESARGLCTDRIAGLGAFRTCFDYPKLVDQLGARLGKPLTHSEASAWFTREAARFIRTQPAAAARLMLRKFLLFWGPDEVGHNKEDELERLDSALLRRIPLTFPVALSLALVGMGLFWMHQRDSRPDDGHRTEVFVMLLLFVVTYSFSYIPFFIAGRYRVPIVPPLLLFGAYGLCRATALLRERNFVSALAAIAAAVLIYLLVSTNVTGYSSDAAKWHFGRGLGYERSRQGERAEEEYAAALSIRPDCVDAQAAMGALMGRTGRLDEGIRHLEEAVRLDPDVPRLHNNLGAAYAMKGEFTNAIAEYAAALKIDPDLAETHINLGAAMAQTGDDESARDHFAQALRIASSSAPTLFKMGLSLYENRRNAVAVDFFRRAIDIAPDLAPAHYYLANTLLFTGKPVEAAEYYRSALRLEPGHAQWMNDFAWVLATHDDPGIRDAADAVRLAEDACRITRQQRPDFLDTLAAAYAEAGRFDEAVNTERDAIRLLQNTDSRADTSEFEERLRIFASRKPFREPFVRAENP